ncbi:hypothetical protein QUF54_05235 [Candidatus Marithioploca araucensis]|uniref:Transposase n=1 Tax=Candidatus Marithioploca araucensis TaxID=70273 RepID=A0ABT7VT33_9GAMM|nr:hypothetical protein [Candidatus Marithioploca araucensis]
MDSNKYSFRGLSFKKKLKPRKLNGSDASAWERENQGFHLLNRVLEREKIYA